MDDSLMQLGVGATIAYILVKEVLGFLKPLLARKNEAPELDKILEVIKQNSYKNLVLLEKLHEMHDMKDEDGVYIWYVKASMGRSINQLSASIDKLVNLLNEDEN